MSTSKSKQVKFLPVVKTYPRPSVHYQEIVCVAGVTSSGEWRRLYPLQYRYLPYDSRFKKYQWIELSMEKHSKDKRTDSYRPDPNVKILDFISTKGDPTWSRRHKYVLKNNVKNSLDDIIRDYRSGKISLGLFKPKIIDFYSKKDDSDWGPRHKDALQQLKLFGKQPKRLEKIPYQFRYKFTCNDKTCKGHDLEIHDWEVFEAYRTWSYPHNQKLSKIRDKWLSWWSEDYDSYLIVGSRYPFPSFIVLGVFRPKKDNF